MIMTNEIKAQMRRVGMTQESLARKLRINPSTLNRKINNASGEKITVAEANEIAEALDFRKEDLAAIFFAEKLA